MLKDSRSMPSRWPFLLSGFLTIFAYPPFNLWFIAWFSLVPLLLNSRSLTFGMAFRRGWWGGLIFNAGSLYWIALNSGAEGLIAPLSFLGLLLVFPLYWGFFTGLWAVLWKRWGNLAALLLPAIWVGLEVVKNLPEIGFPWMELGLTQIGALPVCQLAELGGIRLVSAWVMTANVAFFLLLRGQVRVAGGIALVLIAGFVWGAWRMNHLPEAGKPLEAVIVQGNVDPAEKWRDDPEKSLSLYEDLTREALQDRPADIVIWPETAIPVYLGYQLKYAQRIQSLASEYNTSILTGAPHYELTTGSARGHERYNAAFFFPADGSQPLRYDKIRLVPFGERVPFQKFIPSLGELNFGQAEFTPGKRYSVFNSKNGIRVSAQICFESIFGRESRRFVQRGARVLCNLTNDGWYGRSTGPYQHAALVRFICIETRCPLLRSANTGISLAADRAGRVIDYLPLGTQGTLSTRVYSGGDALTFYVKHGELIPRLLVIAGLAGLFVSAVQAFVKGR